MSAELIIMDDKPTKSGGRESGIELLRIRVIGNRSIISCLEDLGLYAPDFYLDAAGKELGETIGNIIAKSYALMVEQKARCAADLG